MTIRCQDYGRVRLPRDPHDHEDKGAFASMTAYAPGDTGIIITDTDGEMVYLTPTQVFAVADFIKSHGVTA